MLRISLELQSMLYHHSLYLVTLMIIAHLSGMVHTESESLQEGLRDVWTCRMILASAYMLHYLSAT